MLRIAKYIALVILFSALGLMLSAAYLTDMPVTITQPDGSTYSCFASGDEYHNWLHDKDKYTIIQDPASGEYRYAAKQGDKLIPSIYIPGRDLPRNLTPGLNISEADYKAARATKFAMPETRDAPTTGIINNLVVFIRFSGEAEFGQTLSTYDGWFNSNTSSQKNYFLEASYNQLTVNTSFYPAAVNGNVVSWQSSNPRSYYQPYNATTNPNGYNGDTQRRDREFTLLQNACTAVSNLVPSNLTIDADNDGNVDNVVFIISGGADGWAELLWPHRWAIYDRYAYIRGKRVYDFNLQLQTFLSSSSVGVICHEFFHTLGAPDLYHYTDNGISPVGGWDIMESNANPPQHMGAFMKFKYGDWISSIPTISASGTYTLNPLTMQSGSAYRINSNNPSQYYVVEFRKKTGTFENSLPGSGLLIYRINTAANGNADGPPDEVYLYRPGGTTTVNGTVNSANYSLETGRRIINNTTNPTPFLQDGSLGNLNIYEIGSSSGSTITFKIGTPPEIVWNYANSPYLEGLENASFPPEGWSTNIVFGSYSFERATSGDNPTCSPFAGTGMLRYNSYSANNGSAAIFTSPKLQIRDSQIYSYQASFAMYRDSGYASNAEKIEAYLNTTASLDGSPTLLGTVHRSMSLTPTVASAGWYQYSFNIPGTLSGDYFLVLKATSAYGNNIYLDNITLSRSTILPLTETFDALTTPNIPSGYGKYILSSSTSALVQTTTTYPNSGTVALQMSNAADATAELRFVSPALTAGVKKTRFTLSARGGGNGYQLEIGTVDSISGTFSLYTTLTLGTIHSTYTVNFGAYTGTNKYIALRHGLGGTYRTLYIDDLSFSNLPTRDLSVTAFSPPSAGNVNETLSFPVTIHNAGLNTITSYQVRLKNATNSSLLYSQNFTTGITSNSSVNQNLSYAISTPGIYQLYAEVYTASDANAANNISATKLLQVLPQATDPTIVGDAAIATTANTLPFNFYWKNSISETVYLASDLFFPSGNIQAIQLPYNFVQTLSDKALKVWAKNVSTSNLATSWLSFEGYTLVFDGNVDFSAGSGTLHIPFTTPFTYTGENLALRFNRPMDIQYFDSANHFIHNTDAVNSSRSRYLYSDSTVYDPTAPSATGTLSNLISLTSFIFSDVNLDAVTASIAVENQQISLQWPPIRGARSYQISHSEDMLVWIDLPRQDTATFSEPGTSKRFYKVTASTEAIERMPSSLRSFYPVSPPHPRQDQGADNKD